MSENLIKVFTADYADYLSDESRRAGTAGSISFPTSEDEVATVVRETVVTGEAITTQGARTGIVAGAVPQGGHVMNLSRMDSIGEVKGDRLTVGPGATLVRIREKLAGTGLFFPPDPTEATASIGGMVACNASGAASYRYGPTRNWVTALRIVLTDGDTLAIRRGEARAAGRRFSLATESGRLISGDLPSYTQPNVKSAAGYYITDDMDLIDLFIGSEGTLGIITEIELLLRPVPAAVHGLSVFLPEEESAMELVHRLRSSGIYARPAAVEFFNSDALALLRKARAESSAFDSIPALKPHYHTAIYTEFHEESDEAAEEAVMCVIEAVTELGGSDEDSWYATTEREMEPIKAFRHAVPEAVNMLIGQRKRTCPELTKLGTDMSVPDSHLRQIMSVYAADLQNAGLESVIFGHIGNNHVHVNILPRSMEDYEAGKALYLKWAEGVVLSGGSISAEHGIGKIKAPFLRLMYGESGISEMQALRRIFDPDVRLNPGNLF